MEKGEKLTGGPYWTQNWIEAMWRFTAERFVDFDTGTVDFEALGREEYEFRKALFFRNFKNSPRAMEAFDAAADDYSKKVANGQKGGRPRKSITADGDTREDSQDCKSATSSNLYGDTREHSRGRYAPPSCSPDDGNPAETAPSHGESVASLEARQGQARESQRRAGADSVRGTPSHSAPARQRAKNSRCPKSREEFHAFVADNNLHEGLAEEWYAIHEARGWVDENGNPIKNWRGALKNFCIKVEQKRRTA